VSEPIDCAECQEQVHEYLQREVHADLANAITAHIANCDHCEEIYDSEDALNQVIRDNCTRETPEDIINKIREHIAGLN
jgi:anti-sigma factor (TIGR02949 family)